MKTAIVLYTRDLRVHDQPALVAAVAAAERIVPLFVFDPPILNAFGAPNRVSFLLDALADLDGSLRERGGALFVRGGEVVAETMRVAQEARAEAMFLSEDVSAYAQSRERRLRRACGEQRLELHVSQGVTVVSAGDLAPVGKTHFSVFTPYWRRWAQEPRRAVLAAPRRIDVPPRLPHGRLLRLAELVSGQASPELIAGGETAGRARLDAWLRSGVEHYGALHDDLAADGTSRLSAFLHFGCLSPLEVAERAAGREGSEPFLRQLAWRDFYAQLLAARPETAREDFRPRGDRWRRDPRALAAWKEGRTGYPIVDAGMRQLAAEGFMHNRARLLTASFLVKDLRIDWRLGAAHFFDLLVDGDVANNVGNWQWVAGTGVDTRPNRIFNPTTQAKRYDRSGDYVRRYVHELPGIEGAAVHEPWKLGSLPGGYPAPIVAHAEAAARFRRERSV